MYTILPQENIFRERKRRGGGAESRDCNGK
jgi:hypothetical protein